MRNLEAHAADALIRRCQSWTDFQREVAGLSSVVEQGRAFERLTQIYLRTNPTYIAVLKHVWRLPEVPAEVRTRLCLPGADEGIDLIAEGHDGGFWAIQCKYVSRATATVTRGALATFSQLAFGHCRHISLALVAHTSSQPIKKIELLHATQLPLATWVELDWPSIHTGISHRAARPTPRWPRPHQQRAIDAAREHFVEQGHTRGRLVMPCGTGKTLAAFWIARALGGRNILVAVPSLALVKQTVEDWAREWVAHGERPALTIVCSDQSTGQLAPDSFVSNTYDLGLPTHTDVDEIAARLDAHRDERHLVFTTYQSSRVLAHAARHAGITFDLAILDEAHKTVGAKTKAFAILLHDRNVPIARRVCMTATERVLRGRNDDVLSMDDASVYGQRFHLYTFKQAIADGVVSDYRILTVTVAEQTIARYVRENRLLTLDGAKDALATREATALAAGVALQRAFRDYGITHAISFHRSIRVAQQFRDQQDALDDGTGIVNLHISGELPAGRRSALLDHFTTCDRALVTNARCLTEGVDVPAIDCVLFADPKASTVDIVQATGRAMRRAAGKNYGYVLLPLVVPDGMTVDEFTETTPFKHIARVVTTLSTQDDRIAEEFRAIMRGEIPSGQLIQITGDVPVGTHLDADAFVAAIRTEVWARAGRANWRPFAEAREFARSLGLRTADEWFEFAKGTGCPPDIPYGPHVVYSLTGWSTFGDWLGTGAVARGLRSYRSFGEARAFARSLGLRSGDEWFAFAKSGRLPSDIPADPRSIYRDSGWHSMRDWLLVGTVAVPSAKWRPFEEARAFVRGLNLNDEEEWRAYSKSVRRPADIPAAPALVYSGSGWQGMGDWLGTGRRRGSGWRQFTQARHFARSLALTSVAEWRAFCRSSHRPKDIPTNPWTVYRDLGWISVSDWLGSRRRRAEGWRTFVEAREFVRSLGLRSQAEWNEFSRSSQRPDDIPASPRDVYAQSGWISTADWLGTSRRRGEGWRPFIEARRVVRELGLTSQRQWYLYSRSGRRPRDIPSNPSVVYRTEGWRGYPDWLGYAADPKPTSDSTIPARSH